ncbi:MAG: hypothetical protein M1831_002983 [Alyxoria varia]|nr:MAG: hypothetical protein M1831_002983 [Alyxoria varia]
MAPSVGHLHKLVARNFKLVKHAWKQLESRIPASLRSQESHLQPIPVRASKQPVHPLAALKQSKGRYQGFTSVLNSTIRQYTTSAGRVGTHDKTSLPYSRTYAAIKASPGNAPFASTLRPNLTGGALPRTAGGYSLGSGRVGGARYFSHTPAAPAQVVHNVSQAVRAFWLSGQKAQFAGVDPVNGTKQYRAVTTLQDETARKVNSLPKATPGSFIDFQVNPTITALTPLGSVPGFSEASGVQAPQTTLNTDGLLDVLSVDFSRALKDLIGVLNDLKSLCALGDLPITYHTGNILRIHFPGCDQDTVENLCQELGVSRGVVTQDPDFETFVGTDIALLFPFAPSREGSEAASAYGGGLGKMKQDEIDYNDMFVEENEKYSTRSEGSFDALDEFMSVEKHTWSPEGYESISSPRPYDRSQASSPLEYQDFEGIYKFIELCNDARR